MNSISDRDMGPIGICAIFRNESLHLLEWIAYHLAIGFDHIVLFDNDSSDGGADVVRGSVFASFVTLIDWPQRPGQLTANQYFCDHFARSFEWVAFIDVDEFLHPLEHASVQDVLPRYEDASCVQVQWLTFGSSGHVARPSALTLQAYDMRLPDWHMRCGSVKSFARGRDLIGMTDSPHVMEVTGRTCNTRGTTVRPVSHLPRCHDVMVLNHYYTRSEEDWIVKRGRGFAFTSGRHAVYRDENFTEHNANATVRDERIKRFVPLVKQVLASGPTRAIAPVHLGANAGPQSRPPTGAAPGPEQALRDRPVIHIEQGDVLIDQMIQLMMALKFASLVPGCLISNIHMPTWGISLPRIEADAPDLTLDNPRHADLVGLAERMNAGEFRRLRYGGFSPRMANFLDREQYRGLFQSPRHKNVGYGDDYLVCHLGAGDTPWRPDHSFVLAPVDFYQEIVSRTGLRPVFLGETTPGEYVMRIREALPEAIVLPPGYVVRDFEIIRQSHNLVVGCSRLCWLAAWLSDAREIFFPLNGALNPFQDQQFDLLPFQDPRYRFHLFPINYAIGEADQGAWHRAMKGLWREVTPNHLQRLLAEAPRVPRRIEPFLELFDEAYYVAQFSSVRQGIKEGWLKNGLAHFTRWGFHDGARWWGFDLDEGWYLTQYPMAALEIGQGDYTDCRHHYAEIGRRRGYKPTPTG